MTNVISFDNAQHDRRPIAIPSWVPADVAAYIRNRIEPIAFLTAADHEAARRLANDPLMESVWTELKNRQGLDRLFDFVWHAAQDGLRETTRKENEAQKAMLSNERDVLRTRAERKDRKADSLLQHHTHKQDTNGLFLMPSKEFVDDIKSLRAMAALLRGEADVAEIELTFLRGPDDPLTRSYGRGTTNKVPSVNSDTGALGVGKMIAEFLRENFGTPMYGTARVLMIVALGLGPDKAPTKSAIRVAFKKGRCAQGR
jgi:hypothetical protein